MTSSWFGGDYRTTPAYTTPRYEPRMSAGSVLTALNAINQARNQPWAGDYASQAFGVAPAYGPQGLALNIPPLSSLHTQSGVANGFQAPIAPNVPSFGGDYRTQNGFNPNQPTFGTGPNSTEILAQILADRNAQFDRQLQRTTAPINRDYRNLIDSLEAHKDDIASGKMTINDVYEEWRANTEALPTPAAVEDLPPSTVDQEVAKVYADAEGALGDVLGKIGATAPGAVGEYGHIARQWESVIRDQLRTDLSNIDLLHTTSGRLAEAFANAANVTDAFGREMDRAKLEAQFNKEIADTQKEIQDAFRDWHNAVGDATMALRDQFGSASDINAEDMWKAAQVTWLKNQGLNDFEINDLITVYDNLQSAGPFNNASQLRSTLQQTINEANLQQLGLLDGLNAYIDGLQDTIASYEKTGTPIAELGDQAVSEYSAAVSALTNLQNGLSSIDLRDATTLFVNMLTAAGFSPDLGDIDMSSLDSISDQTSQYILDMWSFEKDFKTNYDARMAAAQNQIGYGGSNVSVNGRDLTTADMVQITNGTGRAANVHPLAAPYFQAAITAYENETGRTISWTDSYRPYAAQAKAYDDYINGRRSNPAPVASPDGSYHPRGMAIDFTVSGVNDPFVQWMVRNGATYGIVNPFRSLSTEPWHWEFHPNMVA